MNYGIAFLALMILVATGCDNTVTNQNLDVVSKDDPSIGCEEAAREYFATARPQSNYGSRGKAMEIVGVSIRAKSPYSDSQYMIQVDGNANGVRVTESAMCEKFTRQGKVYWKVGRAF